MELFTTMMILVLDCEYGRAPGEDFFYFWLGWVLIFFILTICEWVLYYDKCWAQTIFGLAHWDFLSEIYNLGQMSWDKKTDT